MNICIPVIEDMGLESSVSAHFGSAPFFMIVDIDKGSCRALTNQNQHHAHGMCQPVAALQGEKIDAMLVGGIGMGALYKLNAAGVQVYLSRHTTAAETVEALKAGSLKPMQPGMACQGHGHGHGHP